MRYPTSDNYNNDLTRNFPQWEIFIGELANRLFCFIKLIKLKESNKMMTNDDLSTASSACEFLRDCIKYLKRESGDLSTLQISRKLGIPNSTLGRIENLAVETPDFNNAMKIIRARCKDGTVNEFINKFYPQMAHTFNKVYSDNANVPFVPTEVETYFEEASTYEFMLLATSKVKMTEKFILENYGKRGLATINELIERGVLKKQGDRIQLSNGPVNAGQETVHKLLQNLITFNYDVNAFGKKENWLSLQYESIDKKAVMPKVVAILREARQKIRELLNSPSSEGNDVVWIGIAADTIEKLDPSLEANKGVRK